MNTCSDHRTINVGDAVECGGVLAGYDFDDPFKGVFLVARVDPFWRVAKGEVDATFHSGYAL